MEWLIRFVFCFPSVAFFLTPPARLMAVADSAADLLQRIIGFQAEGILD
jgi:hypothetical protein